MTQNQNATSSKLARPAQRGPVSILLSAALGILFAVAMSWMLGIAVEIVGLILLWPAQGAAHAQSLVDEGLAQLAAYPSCALTADTVQTARTMTGKITEGFSATGILKFIEVHGAPVPEAANQMLKMKRAIQVLLRLFAKLALIALFVAQSIVVRLAVVLFAAPLFALLALLAIIDGLVRRDLRKWSGGRESSFVYHYAKRMTAWGLTGGFAIYLAWPFGGMPLVAVVLTLYLFAAWSMSVTVGSFKKYL